MEILALSSVEKRWAERFVKLWNLICAMFRQKSSETSKLLTCDQNEKQSSETSKLLPCDQNDKQPLYNRFPSNIEIGSEKGSDFNLSSLAKIFLLISANLCLSASAYGLRAGKSLSENARSLLSSAGICSLVGFLLCSCGYVFQNSRRAKLAARLMTGGGVVAATFGLVLMIVFCLSSKF